MAIADCDPLLRIDLDVGLVRLSSMTLLNMVHESSVNRFSSCLPVAIHRATICQHLMPAYRTAACLLRRLTIILRAFCSSSSLRKCAEFLVGNLVMQIGAHTFGEH